MMRSRWLAFLLLAIALALLVWALRAVPLTAILAVLAQLSLPQIILLLLVNTFIVLLFGLRWWLILREQGHRLPYLRAAAYRLAAFGVSYFTPGPQFGGEPLQVIFARNRHNVPGSAALASVTLDKVVELLSNFAFLAIGLALVLRADILLDLDLLAGQGLALALLLLPLLYLLLLAFGRHPLSWAVKRLLPRFAPQAAATEDQLSGLVRQRPRLLLLTFAASALVWLALLFEYWLALRYLDLQLDLLPLLAIVVAARLSMLAPTPGALGALEAGQVIAMQSLGFDPAIGLSLSLLIRARDLLFGGLGLWLAFAARRKP